MMHIHWDGEKWMQIQLEGEYRMMPLQMPTFTTAHSNISNYLPIKCTFLLQEVITYSFYLKLLTLPQSSLFGQLPHPPGWFYQPTCPHTLNSIQLQWRKCACSPLWLASTCALNPSSPQILRLFALASTYFLFCIIFFSFSTCDFHIQATTHF